MDLIDENINIENIKPIKVKKSNYEAVKRWKLNHREQHLKHKTKLNTWNKYKKIYLNILLE